MEKQTPNNNDSGQYQADYHDTFQNEKNHSFDKEYNQINNEQSEPPIINMNTSDLSDQKNGVIKKIQFYVTMVVGVIFFIIVLYSFFKNISNDEKKEKVTEIEAVKVQKLEKSNLFEKINEEKEIKNDNKVDEPKETKSKNPFEDKNADIFDSLKINPPKPQIIKGSSTAIVSSNNKKSSSSNGASSSYDSQIEELEAQQAMLQNLENLSNGSSSGNGDYSGDKFTPATVTLNEFNPDLLLPKGTYIGCSLDTRFVSAIQGSTSCTVSQNVYSANGNVLLIERGSKLFGTYKGDNASDGSSRYFVIWQEIRTPNHLRIPVNSGSSDELGGAGLEGEIDHKWLMRFGSSIMLSAIDDLWNVLAWKITNNNNNANNSIDYTENSREAAKNISSIALEKFINIKPTIYKQHGDLVGVYVNRDIDFSKVYKISRKSKK